MKFLLTDTYSTQSDNCRQDNECTVPVAKKREEKKAIQSWFLYMKSKYVYQYHIAVNGICE